MIITILLTITRQKNFYKFILTTRKKITILWSFFENGLRKLEGGEFLEEMSSWFWDIVHSFWMEKFSFSLGFNLQRWVVAFFPEHLYTSSSIIINGDGPVWNIVLVFLNKLSFWVKFFFIKHWYFLSSGGSKPNKPAVSRMQPLNNECWIFQTP